ncbi:MAG: CRISPR-associated endonuclease Cas1 [Crenarchaeota archaeon]|nr:CRISPR-associated endonuclease Cas1 [Thermoproteota archaeon]
MSKGGKILLIDEWGSRLRVRKGMLVLFVRENNRFVKKIEISPVELDSIIFWIRGSSVSTAAIIEAARYCIDLVIFDNGRPVARIVPAKYGSIYRIWTRQLIIYHRKEKRLKIARAFVYGKIDNQISNLRYFSRLVMHNRNLYYMLRRRMDDMYSMLQKLNDCKSVDEVRNVEAAAARIYWKALKELVPRNLGFKRRLKRYDVVPGMSIDPVNKALNIGYGILRKEVWRAIFMAGLNPYIGFLHKPRPGRLSLIFDLMEEFRPLIDRIIISCSRKTPGKLKPLTDNEKEAEGVANVFRIVYEEFQRRNIVQMISVQARRLLNYVLREEPYTYFRLV